MTRKFLKISAIALSLTIACTGLISSNIDYINNDTTISAYTENIQAEDGTREYGSIQITGGGFVSGIVTGKEVMYARTDVGGAYKYNYDTNEWEQLMGFISENDKGYLSVEAIAIDPTDDDTVYMFCGCAYFSDARSAIFKTTDGGKTFTEVDVTDLIQTHANGDGRHFGERLVVDPEDTNTIYCGGRTGGLIKSTDGGETWAYVQGFQDLGLFSGTTKWPLWTEHIVNIVDADDTAYNSTNGVSSLAISDGKLFVGVSVQGKPSVYVSSDNGETFEPLSDELPTDTYPSRFNLDADGNVLITYAGALAFSGGGGAYRYNIKDGTIDNISPTTDSYGAVFSDPNDSNKLVATTCGLWYSQLWHEDDWENEAVAWGDITFRSTDGGKTWKQLAPGNQDGWGGPLQADYLQDGGVSWVEGKAIHWTGCMVMDPRNPSKVFVTSGNGIFACDDIWADCPQYYFHADGIEEVVALDMTSVKGGNVYSAIGDYDGFIHYSPTESKQYTPNIGSTSAIAYCPSNPDVMVRFSEHQEPAYYSMDAGETWTQMEGSGGEGGKAAITQLEDGTYRIFHAVSGGVSYTDDFGKTWTSCGINGIYYQSVPYTFVDLENPSLVYAYGYYNDPYTPNASKPYRLYVSTDYGTTFSSAIDICQYDGCDSATRIAYLGEDDLILAGGWYGLYHVTNQGKNIESLNVFYCKTVGYGAPKDENSPNTLYIWGRPTEDDTEGIYASTDAGETWFRVNDDEHSYGGTGNGNFIVGDMNTYGTFYMSTVGAGIVYSRLTDGSDNPEVTTTTKPTETTTTTITKEDYILTGTVSEIKGNDVTIIFENEDITEITINLDTLEAYDITLNEGDSVDVTFSGSTDEPKSINVTGQGNIITTPDDTVTTTSSVTDDGTIKLGDVNSDGKINVADLILLRSYILHSATEDQINKDNSDVNKDNKINVADLIQIRSHLLHLLDLNAEE